ncbi:MAG TPA: hypothetical protein VFB33_00240 [Candidatus Binataceae bacterium]|nr:hypothetical protein [Candidatus Binataceae bacterium]
MGRIQRLWRKAGCFGDAQTMTEYSLILALVAIVAFSAYLVMGNNLDTIANQIDVFVKGALSVF